MILLGITSDMLSATKATSGFAEMIEGQRTNLSLPLRHSWRDQLRRLEIHSRGEGCQRHDRRRLLTPFKNADVVEA